MEETIIKVDVWETPLISKFHKLTTFIYQHEFLKRLVGRLIDHVVANLPNTSPAIIINIDKLIFESVQNFSRYSVEKKPEVIDEETVESWKLLIAFRGEDDNEKISGKYCCGFKDIDDMEESGQVWINYLFLRIDVPSDIYRIYLRHTTAHGPVKDNLAPKLGTEYRITKQLRELEMK